MKSFVHSFVLACALVPVVYGVFPMTSRQNVFSPRLAARSPVNSLACFSNYIDKSNEVSETYSRDYNQCLLDAKAGRQGIEAEMVGKRIEIGEISEGICKRLSTCDGLNSTFDVFNCHAKIGSNNTKSVYSISGNASEYANIMHEKYRVIDLRHEQCCKSAERKYVEATAASYRNLQDCLDGRVAPSTTTTTTTTTTPEPTTTMSSTTSATISSTTELEPSTKIPVVTTSEGPKLLQLRSLPDTKHFAKLLKLF